MRNGSWCLPRHQPDAAPCLRSTAHVINFVLDADHVVMVNGERCITWGHCFTDPTVADGPGSRAGVRVAHGFFGTRAIIDDLVRIGSRSGVTAVGGFARNGQGEIVGFTPNQSTSSPDVGMPVPRPRGAHGRFAGVDQYSGRQCCMYSSRSLQGPLPPPLAKSEVDIKV